jgi:hypothetical protein
VSLPAEIIDGIWAKLAIAYGHRFLSVWEGLPQDVVKADWAERLHGVPIGKIEWALDNLPAGKPPEAMEFRQLCGRMPEPAQSRLALTNEKPGAKPAGIEELARQFRVQDASRHAEPERVRWARRYIEQFGGHGLLLRANQRVTLADARKILALHEGDQDIERRKRETQVLVDQHLGGGDGQ